MTDPAGPTSSAAHPSGVFHDPHPSPTAPTFPHPADFSLDSFGRLQKRYPGSTSLSLVSLDEKRAFQAGMLHGFQLATDAVQALERKIPRVW